MDTLIVILVVGAAAAFVALKAVKAARTVARGGAPACCGGPDGPAGRAAEPASGRPEAGAAPDASEGSCEDRAAAAGLPSPCASCPGCAGH